MFLGWYDPDKKRPARLKLADALARYQEKFGRLPVACLTSPEDAAELADDKKVASLTRKPLQIRAVNYVPRYTYYVGVDDEPVVLAEAA